MKTIFRFLKPYKKQCLITILVLALDVLGALLIPKLTGRMIDVGVGNKDINFIIQTGLTMLAVSILAGVGSLIGSWLCAKLSARIGQDMRNEMYQKTMKLSSQDIEKFGTNSLITRSLNDINIVQQAFVMTVQMILPVPIMCIGGIIMAFSTDWMMGLLLVGVTLVLLVCAFFITRKASIIFGMLQKHLDKINGVVRENITGMRVVRAFHKEKYEENRMRKTFDDYAKTSIKANRLFAGLECLAYLIINICIVLILWFGGNRIGLGEMQIGNITELIGYATLILWYLIMAQMVILLLPRAKICFMRINEVLNNKPQIEDGKLSPNLDTTKEVCCFHNASFRFADADEATLIDLNFVIKRGETTAIIGSTGSGKSTIAKLLLRFHDITEGAILWNGQNIKDISQHDLRNRISYVPQKAWLFSGTIAENLRYGNENATEEELKHALAVSQSSFVEELPDGIYSRVAQGGNNFSGGQKQRLAIARALVKKADLYIFDDSFSALDFRTDALLRKALLEEVKDSAVLIIAQRINTIMNADNIIVLDEGKFVAIGTHEELLEKCAIYAEISRSQLKGSK